MRDTVKVGWSGGKDSTCSVLMHIEKGDKVKAVCYVPMFTDTIPLIAKSHYEYIIKTAEYFRSLGADVHIVSGMTYYEYVTHIAKRGKYKGMIFGFPYFKSGQCGFKRDSKLKALAGCDVGSYDYEDIGIAVDEVARHGQLTDKKRSILCEEGITEAIAKRIVLGRGLLSPHYGRANRDGCALCPNAKQRERVLWLQDYPEALPILLELQELVKAKRPDRTPLRGYKWFIENGEVQ